MQAMTVVPGQADSARLSDRDEPDPADGDILVDGLAVGICGTDRDIIAGIAGTVPAGRHDLVLGHESLGRVATAPTGSGLTAGDLVVGIVRRPDTCTCCRAGQWDYCRTGNYTERGIKGADGYGAARWRIPAEYAIRLDPTLADTGVLMEPTSIVAKAWEQIDLIRSRCDHTSRTALITGAGPIGLLAALLATQRGYDTHVYDLATTGPKPALVADLGATYHTGTLDGIPAPDAVIDATGVGQLVLDISHHAAPNAVLCLTGIADTHTTSRTDTDALNRRLVMTNQAIVGSVNAAHRHYPQAATALAAADPGWLHRLITRRVPLHHWTDALDRHDDDVKVVVDLTA